MSETNVATVIDLITGRWRSQILYAGVKLGVFDALAQGETLTAGQICRRLKVDSLLLHRLLRALSSIGLLHEASDGGFTATPSGQLLSSSHPKSLGAMALLEEGPVHCAAWKHLPDLIRDGVQDGFSREFGMSVFEYLEHDSLYASVFSNAMSSYSSAEAEAVRDALSGTLLEAGTFCDVGGGFGSLIAALLEDRPAAKGIVLDLPKVTADQAQHVTRRASLGGRCTHVAGDMFISVPKADVYVMKHVLHDWSDAECANILSVIRQAATASSRLMIFEWILPVDDRPDFSKLMDIHMMCVSTGRQRTSAEFNELLSSTRWRMERVPPVPGCPLSVVDAIPA